MTSKAIQRWAADNAILLVWAVFFIAASLFIKGFASWYNIKNFLKDCAPLLVVSCGLTIPVLNGGTDFSTTSVISLVSTLCAFIMVKNFGGSVLGIIVAIIVGMLIGTGVGMVNGIAVAKLKMPSFVATLSTKLIFSGIAVWFGNLYYDKVSLGGLPEAFIRIGGKGDFFWLPVVIAVVIFLFLYWMLKHTLFGRRIYAVGVNPRTASISGVPVRKTIFCMMTLSGLLAGIGGLMYTAKNAAGITTLGDEMFINFVGSVVIGGTSPGGGFGGVKKTLYGVLFLVTLDKMLNLLGVPYTLYDVVKGIFVLLAASMELITRQMNARAAARAMSES